ncbi:class I adenylate-forming enzyme family protein [Frankia gtarii]|uniref:class I adenylate-forming enzyme family protein n=1 Tax=Frankia gtarii TaxID=2950102 RepID=UPI0021BEBD94|nr:class I adenylate-forming enzyme family protein [Frankia gtarii]
MAGLLDKAAQLYPRRTFVITERETFTYAEIQARSERLARGLRAAGVRAGNHVALVLGNHPEFVLLTFAIARVGAVAVPVNIFNRRDELAYVLRQADVTMLVTMDRSRGYDYLAALDEIAPGWQRLGGGSRLPSLKRVVVLPTDGGPLPSGRSGAAVTTLADLERHGSVAPDVTPGGATPQSLAAIFYTSGTTGDPKGVMHTHDMLVRTAYGSAYTRAYEDGRSILFSLPLYHVYAFVEGLLTVPFVGGSVVIQRAFDPIATLAAIERHRPNDVLFVPTMTLDVLAAAREHRHDLSSLTAMFSSGGQAPERIWREIIATFGRIELVTGYGMTETTASQACTLPEGPFDRLPTTNGRLKDAGAAGDPAIGGRLAVWKVVDPHTGRPVPPGTVGELLTRGPAVTKGYYRKPAETATAFDAAGWLRTGDLGTVDEYGYLVLAGRKKDCYRCGGEQVMPREIEAVLTTHPAVAQAHVVSLPDERMGEVGVAWVVFADHIDSIDGAGPGALAAELVAYCAQRLARFKVPRHVLPISPAEIPTTASGRPRKFLLAERAMRVLGVSAEPHHAGLSTRQAAVC